MLLRSMESFEKATYRVFIADNKTRGLKSIDLVGESVVVAI